MYSRCPLGKSVRPGMDYIPGGHVSILVRQGMGCIPDVHESILVRPGMGCIPDVHVSYERPAMDCMAGRHGTKY